MKPLPSRRFRPRLAHLERRELLSGAAASAVWIGQDGRDYAGGAQPLAGNGVQDIHVALSGLPAAETVATVDVKGYGGGEWVENIGPYSRFNAVIQKAAGSTTADLYLDPYITETGRSFDLTLTYADGTTSAVHFNGGTADPNLRMPVDALTDSWLGQDGKDYTGPGAGVGPDGYQDVHVSLSNLFPGTALSSVTVKASPSNVSWGSGTNVNLLNNAELFPNASDPTKADLYFSPLGNLAGQTLTVTAVYADGKIDHATLQGGTSSPTLAMPALAAVNVNWNTLSTQWLGQDGLNLLGLGDAHIAVSNIPTGRSVVSAAVSDQTGSTWVYLKPNSGASTAEAVSLPLGFRVGTGSTKVDLTFPPVRNENGSTLTVRLVLDDGTILAAKVVAGTTDPGLRAADVASSTVVAYPGDDLNDLANRYGHVRLAGGTYSLTQPLVLNHAVSIEGSPGSLLVFSQAADAPTWTAAIKVNSSHTTLSGFAVRFSTTIRWTDNISYGPAVIGVSDNYDLNNYDPKVDLSFTNLDLQSPPSSSTWEEAVHLFRLVNAANGTISDNLMKGGTSEFFGGPWTITGNTYLGTPVNTFSYGVFSGHYTHDVTITNNTASNAGPSGKTWRFLVLTDNGFNDSIRNNVVVGLGPMDADTVPNPNAPEVILTEAYQFHYEGIALRVSPDGLVVQIPGLISGQVRSGDVLSVLNGSQAGTWRLISQVINSNTFLLASPITPGSFDISITTGFVNMVIDRNTIDSRGSSVADDLVLAGNQFGATITNNNLLGGDRGFRISAFPTESGYFWGWTHVPFLGATVSGNTLTDTLHGGMIDVERSQYTKSSDDRVYFTATFTNNTAVWTAGYLAARTSTDPLRLVTVGNSLTADAGELILNASGNTASAPSGVSVSSAFYVIAGTLNGKEMSNQSVALAAQTAPSVSQGSSSSPLTTVVETPVSIPSTPVTEAAPIGPFSVVQTTQPVIASGPPSSSTIATVNSPVVAVQGGVAAASETPRQMRLNLAALRKASVAAAAKAHREESNGTMALRRTAMRLAGRMAIGRALLSARSRLFG